MNLFRTSDLNLAAFLQEVGYHLVNTERSNGKVTLVFNDPENKAEGHALSFLNGAKVSAVTYTDKLRHLKTVVMRGVGG